jgi:hypothetical protein
MYFDIDKAQLSALGKLNSGESMEKLEVLNILKKTRTISTDMLPAIGMPFEVFLKYAKFSEKDKQKIVNKAIKKLDPNYCDACECSPCDCGYGSY